MTRSKIARTWIAGALVAATVAASCSSDNTSSSSSSSTGAPTETTVAVTDAPSTTPDTDAPASSVADSLPIAEQPLTEPDAATKAGLDEALGASPAGCDPLDGRACLFPFPSNAYTKADDRADSGLRVNMPAGAAGANASGVVVNLTEWNRNDGFSPDSTLLTFVPGLDATKSALPSWTDLQSSLADDAAVVMIDTDSGERVPLWAELDAKAVEDADRSLVIHPAISLTEGHHFVVALRRLFRSAAYNE